MTKLSQLNLLIAVVNVFPLFHELGHAVAATLLGFKVLGFGLTNIVAYTLIELPFRPLTVFERVAIYGSGGLVQGGIALCTLILALKYPSQGTARTIRPLILTTVMAIGYGILETVVTGLYHGT